MKLLIVEDNASVRRLIRSIFASRANEIHECADGIDALSAYQAHCPEFVLMDIAMERLNGIAATIQILASDPRARIIIVTDYDDPALREAAREAGACGYVLKENLIDVERVLQTLVNDSKHERNSNE